MDAEVLVPFFSDKNKKTHNRIDEEENAIRVQI